MRRGGARRTPAGSPGARAAPCPARRATRGLRQTPGRRWGPWDNPGMEIARELELGLPHGSVLVDREALKPYECDGLSAYRATPLVAAIPTDEAEGAAVLQVGSR